MTQETSTIPSRGILHREWWRASFRIWNYIIREFATPFLMSLGVIMFVFLLQFLMRFIDRLVGKGLDFWTIVQLVAFNLAWMFVLAVPMGVLVACVMAFGSMGASNELTAMKAAGVSLSRMLFPVIVLGLGLALFDLQFNNNVLPDANHKAKDLMSDIQRKKPTFAIEAGQFSDEDAIPGYSILARRTVPNTSDLEEVTIYDHASPNASKLLTAKSANVSFTRDFKSIVMTLRDGEFHEFSTVQPTEYRRGVFNTYVVQIPTNGFDFLRQGESERGDRELSAEGLLQMVHARDTQLTKATASMRDHLKRFANEYTTFTPQLINRGVIAPTGLLRDAVKKNSTRKELLAKRDSVKVDSAVAPQAPGIETIKNQFQQKYLTVSSDCNRTKDLVTEIDGFMVEVHKKYAIPVACLIFVLIGAPLGALARRGGVGVGVGLSIGFFVLYWIFLIGGEKLADRNVISPWLGMWGGNILLGALGSYLVWRVSQERPGFSMSKYFNIFKPKKKREDLVTGHPLAGNPTVTDVLGE